MAGWGKRLILAGIIMAFVWAFVTITLPNWEGMEARCAKHGGDLAHAGKQLVCRTPAGDFEP